MRRVRDRVSTAHSCSPAQRQQRVVITGLLTYVLGLMDESRPQSFVRAATWTLAWMLGWGFVPEARAQSNASDAGVKQQDGEEVEPEQTQAPAEQTPPTQAPMGEAPTAEPPGSPPAGASEQGPVLRPPQLVEFSPAQYPEAAAAAGLQARVELELIIDATGKVTQSTVISPVGEGFDEAAREASFNLVFAPATRDGQPIPARVRFPYVFELQPPEPTKDELEAEAAKNAEPPKSELIGQVLDDDRDPVQGAKVKLIAEDGETITRTTGADGRFRFPSVLAATYTVQIVAEELATRTEVETLSPGQQISVVYELVERPDTEAYGAVARIKPPPREVTRRTINRTQLTRIPGTRGDALRAIQLMPGVARPPFGAGLLIIRGSAPQDSQVQLEGAPLPLLYHFGGITSVFSSQLLESIEFFPGNFSTRYGRRRGGIVEVNVRDPKRDGYSGMLDINLLDTYAVAEGPITKDWEVALAFRRSYIDLILPAVLPKDTFDVIAAPVYYDYQAITTYRPSSKDRLRLMLFGSSDRFAVLFAQPSDGTGGASDLSLSTVFNRGHVSWYRHVSDDVDHDFEFAVERRVIDLGLGDKIGFLLKSIPITTRSEWRVRVSETVRLIGGLDIQMAPGRIEYSGPVNSQSEGNPNNSGGDLRSRDFVSRERNYFNAQPAAYFEVDLNLHPLRLVPGIRFDYYSLVRATSIDPRLTSIYSMGDRTRNRCW